MKNRKPDLKEIAEGFIVLQRDYPAFFKMVLSELIRKDILKDICAFLKEEYEKYNKIFIKVEGLAGCEFDGLIPLGDTPGLVAHYGGCEEAIEIIAPMIEKVQSILQTACKLGCAWAKEEAKKLNLHIEECE